MLEMLQLRDKHEALISTSQRGTEEVFTCQSARHWHGCAQKCAFHAEEASMGAVCAIIGIEQ